jgi:hypothetical protein
MVRITGFKFAIAAAPALLLTTFMVFPGASAAYDSGKGQLVAIFATLNTYMRPVLWREPVDIESRDLFYGLGGRDGAPDTSALFTFVRHSKSGAQKKVIVEDKHGREWTVKFGPEARPETTATRIVWAAGYHVDQAYFVPYARIIGKENIEARGVRFERRDDGYEEVGTWKWKENPFVGTRELDGLKVVMALIKNWDLKSTNNEILVPKSEPGPHTYYVSDLGATFGMTGAFYNRAPFLGDLPPSVLSRGKAKGNPGGFAGERFIEEVRGDSVYFYGGRTRVRRALNGVSVANARWMGNLLGRLSDKQLIDAFRAGGFNAAETSLYVSVLRAGIIQLQRL